MNDRWIILPDSKVRLNLNHLITYYISPNGLCLEFSHSKYLTIKDSFNDIDYLDKQIELNKKENLGT